MLDISPFMSGSVAVKDPSLYPSKDLIISGFSPNIQNRAQKKYGDKGGVGNNKILDVYRLEDHEGKEITPQELADRYFTDPGPETCFNSFQENNRDRDKFGKIS